VARRSRVFISHSSKNETYASAIRDAVETKLKELGYDVLLDRSRLDPGDRWRAKLHRWLGACDGAVLLFGPAALQSDWVRKEATILTWRREFETQIRIVPALFGGVAKSALDEYGLGPLELKEDQIAEVDEGAGSEKERARLLAERIARGFDGLTPLVAETPMSRWVEDIADLIRDNSFLENAAVALFERDDFAPGNDPVESERMGDAVVSAERVAYQLLHSEPEAIERAFDELLRGQIRDPKRLAKLITPSWVPAESAKAIVAAAARPAGRRLVALRSSQTSTPEHVVLKGTCSDGRNLIVPPISERATTEAAELELTQLYRRGVLERYGINDSRSDLPENVQLAQEWVERNGKRVFVVLPATATGLAVGRNLWSEERIDRPVYLFAGDELETTNAVATIDGISVIEPELEPLAEARGNFAANRMFGRVEAL